MKNEDKFLKQEDATEDQRPAGDTKRIPVVREQLQIEKRTVEAAKIRVSKKVREEEFKEQIALLKEDVTVERKPVNQYIEGDVPGIRLVGETTIIPVIKEVIVKRILLVEELHITKRSTEELVTVQETLLREEVFIERTENTINAGTIPPSL